MEQRDPAIRITLLPRDTNSQGTIFGGVILSYIDTAGAIEAHRHTRSRVGVFELDRPGHCADDAGAQPGLRVASSSSSIPDPHAERPFADPAQDLEVGAARVAHRVRHRLGDGKLNVRDQPATEANLAAPVAHERPSLGNTRALARESRAEPG